MELKITTNADMVRMGLQDLSKEIPEVGRNQIYLKMRKIIAWMHKPVSKPSYPINWDSPKQKRAYFATDGFGAGIPYKRQGSGGYADSFKIERLDNGYALLNTSNYGAYVGGNETGYGQSNIHKGRWPIFADVAEAVLSDLPQDVDRAINTEIRRIFP